MATIKTLSRKQFFNTLATLIVGSFAILWWKVADRQNETESGSMVWRIKSSLTRGITFHEQFYLVVGGEKAKAFSTRCTHAGCRINKESNGLVICPCHGSKFDAYTGQPVQGPAANALRELSCRFDERSKEWIVKG
ncbi:MAG: Rieske (2Fe-2S) protein [Bacteroidetes bacterium]|nr:Rieske (2Fe-2S) protein [Bacteroidota bacterium]